MHPIFELLRQPIPVLSDLSGLIGGGDITLEDLAEFASANGLLPEGYKELVDIILLVEDLEDITSMIDPSAQDLMINLDDPASSSDDFKLNQLTGSDLRSLNPVNMNDVTNPQVTSLQSGFNFAALNGGFSISQVHDQIVNGLPNGAFKDQVTKVVDKFFKQAQNGYTYSIPLIDNPAQGIVSFLLGHDADLFTFEFNLFLPGQLPDALLQSISLPFGLDVELAGQFLVDAHFKAAYDTRGMRDFVGSGDPSDLLNGFYMQTAANENDPMNSHFNVSGLISATAGASFGFFDFGVEGKVEANLKLHLEPSADSDSDGRLRLYSELDHCFFEVSGAVSAGLYAFAEIGVEVLGEFIGVRKEYEIAGADLISFDFGCIPNPYKPETPYQLADGLQIPVPGDPNNKGVFVVNNPNGVLTLNIGPRASFRNLQSGIDEVDVVAIVPGTLPAGVPPNSVPSGSVVYVSMFGVTETYAGVKKIVADGGAKGDSIVIDSALNVAVVLHGGDGSDTLKSTGSGRADLYGDAGSDLLEGGQFQNFLFGGNGSGLPLGPFDDDTLMGGKGANFMDGECGADVITGGSGPNKIFGGPDDDRLYAGPLNDYMEGGGGDDQLSANVGNAKIYGGRGNDRIFWKAGDGKPELHGGVGRDAISLTGTGSVDTFLVSKPGPFGFDVTIAATPSNLATKLLPLDSMEEIDIESLGGADNVTIEELTFTAVKDVGINLGDILVLDNAADHVLVRGTTQGDSMTVSTESALLKNESRLFGGVERVEGLPNYVVHAANVDDDLKIEARDGADTINVLSIPGPTTIFSNAGADAFNISTSAPSGLGALKNRYVSPIELRADSGIDLLNVSVGGSTASNLIELSASSVSIDWTVLVNNQPTPVKNIVNYLVAGGSFDAGINLVTTAKSDMVAVRSTLAGPLTTVKTGDGNDKITVASVVSTLDGILGNLLIDGQAGANTLEISDLGANSGNASVVVGNAIITGFASLTDSVPIQYQATGGSFANILIRGSNSIPSERFVILDPGGKTEVSTNAGDDRVEIQKVTFPVIVDTGAGDDAVVIGDAAGTLNGILAEVVVTGGVSLADQLRLDDFASAVGRTYQLSPNKVTVNGVAINFADVEAISVRAAPVSDNALVVGAPAAGTTVLFDGGGGAGVDNLQGPVLVNKWYFNGLGAGTLNDNVQFADFEVFVGDSLADEFVFADKSGVAGLISGEGGTDTLNYAAWTTGVRVNFALGSATGIQGTVIAVENAVGGLRDDLLMGSGADNSLFGGPGADVLVGQGSKDLLRGDDGQDVLIGGQGSDALFGDGGEDILIGSSTAFDNDVDSLLLLYAEWSRTDALYRDRVLHLNQGGGLNGPIWLTNLSVADDMSIDSLTGGTPDLDWFWAGPAPNADVITDLQVGEIVN